MWEGPINDIASLLDAHPFVESSVYLLALLALAAIANWIAKRIVLRAVDGLLERTTFDDNIPAIPVVIGRLVNTVPAVIIGEGIVLVPHLPYEVRTLVESLANAFVIFTIARAASAVLTAVNQAYILRPDAAQRPIKGYIQVGKILVYCAAAILIVSTLIGRSPWLLLSGLGALAAVLMLVFKDTILSLVASVQLSSNDMLRVGDWIDMPQYNADGDVIDIALHTVKVQNFDKTITTIPTHKLISESYRNWRGMQESGGRRIKRSLMIDQNSVRFLSESEVEDARRFGLLRAYLDERSREIAAWNADLPGPRTEADRRQMTNLGVFRAYLVAYLSAHPHIAADKTLLVRQLEPSAEGLGLEIYCFTDTTVWAQYEDIQADIFDHLLAVLREFDLRLFQQPTGRDFAQALRFTQALQTPETAQT
ncbi:mechanosensitive ion channel family protein [Stakelama marina]|uniref:Mechanosensing system component YbdG n=1 Tax=Stakelama marina TaxID=2826939 RepID=A0A8T4IGT4_9SPHN|nr:mechanosensitive ion channel domain-containing protein [Stakelama marina]MBR0553807.1 mechanosensitive ion channel [Stakelama marina]